MPYANPFTAPRFTAMTEQERIQHAAWQALALLEEVWSLKDIENLKHVQHVAGDILNLAYPGFTDN